MYSDRIGLITFLIVTNLREAKTLSRVRRAQHQPDSWQREGKWRSDIYSSLLHCSTPKCIPVQHSTFRAQDTARLGLVNPGKKNTTARLYGSSVKLGKLRTIKLLPEPPTKWRRSYSCRREDTALMVSPYGRFLNTTEQENWKRWQINSLRKQPSEGRGARKI